jgi:hypothetical protein
MNQERLRIGGIRRGKRFPFDPLPGITGSQREACGRKGPKGQVPKLSIRKVPRIQKPIGL